MLPSKLTTGFHQRSIAVRLMSLVLYTLLPVAMLMAWFFNHDLDLSRQAAYANVTSTAHGVAAQIDATLLDHELLLKALALDARAQNLHKADRFDFKHVLRTHSLVVAVGVRDLAGRNIYATGQPLPDRVFQESNWGRLALNAQEFYVSDIQPAHGKQGWSVYLTYPIRDARGARTGLVYAEMDLAAWSIRVMAGVSQNIAVPVIDRNDRILMRSGEPEAFIGKTMPKNVADSMRDKVDKTFVASDVSGIPRLFAVLTQPKSGWRVFAGVPQREVFAETIADRKIIILVGLSTLIFSLGFGWFRAATIRRPIAQLESDVARMMGDHQYRSSIRGPLEVEKVAFGLNTLLDQLECQYRDRLALTEHYASMLKNAREVIFLVDAEGRIVEALSNEV